MIQKAYKFRAYPTDVQKVLLNKTFGCVRYAWNQWVSNFNKKEDQVFATPKQFKEQLDWMREVSSAAIQQKEQDFFEFKRQFFNKKRANKLGRPSFKSRKKRQSYRLPNQKFCLKNCAVRLEKIGYVKIVLDRVIPQDVKFINCTVSKDIVGDFFVSVLVEQNVSQLPKTGKEVGIDVGIKSFAVFSDEHIVENPKFFRENQSDLKKIQQHAARKVQGSNNHRRTKRRVSRLQRQIARRRSHFLHNVSSYIVNNYDVIAIEDLNIKGMVKNRCLAKSISDASWSEFFRQLIYKSSWYGKELRTIDRFAPTSKTCSVCGYYFKDLTLGIREWTCPCCGTTHDRDMNAAKSVLKQSAGVEAELQTWSEHQTLGMPTEAALCEVSRIE
jgi:putative transposase